MADRDFAPLTEAERAELEALRAEKARRERAELEELRAEQAASAVTASSEAGATPAGPVGTDAYADSVADPAPDAAPTAPAPQKSSGPTTAEPAERTFGQRMVLSEGEDADGLPSMPPAQKIIIGVCLVCAVGAVLFVALSNAGIIG